MKYACNNYRKTTLSHTFDYGKEVDTSVTLPYTVSLPTSSDGAFASAETICHVI